MKFIISILMCVFSVQAGATALAPLPEPPKDLLPIDTAAPNVPCDQILDALTKFRDMNRQHEDGLIAFLTQTVEKIGAWYDALSPLEGQKNTLDAGTFDPVKQGAEKMSSVVDYSYDNTALLAAELDRIIISLRACQQGAPTKKIP